MHFCISCSASSAIRPQRRLLMSSFRHVFSLSHLFQSSSSSATLDNLKPRALKTASISSSSTSAPQNKKSNRALSSKNNPSKLSEDELGEDFKAWKLNEEQKQAVAARDKYVRVVAGPGSGKTRVLTHRIAFLIKYLRVPPSKIACITYTKKAANELKERLDNLLGHEVSRQLKVGTVHSICASIIRKSRQISDYHLSVDYSICDEDDSQRILRNILQEACHGFDVIKASRQAMQTTLMECQSECKVQTSMSFVQTYHSRRTKILMSIVPEISQFLECYNDKKNDTKKKGVTISADAVEDLYSFICRARLNKMRLFIAEKGQRNIPTKTLPAEFIYKVADIYELDLRRANAVDFDDLLFLVVRLLYDYPEILKDCRNKWKYLLVDEFQDIDDIQYEIIRLLSAGNESLFVVGDSNQAIYEWRGAQSVHMQYSLVQDFPPITTFQLKINYRSTSNILKVASAILNNSGEAGINSSVKAFQAVKPSGETVYIRKLCNAAEEANYIALEIQGLASLYNINWDNIAILYRTHFQSHFIEASLSRLGIPHITVGSKPFCSNKEIKIVISYLHLIGNLENQVALENIINIPNRGIGEKTISLLKEWSSSRNILLSNVLQDIYSGNATAKELRITKRASNSLKLFWKLIEELNMLSRNKTVGEIMEAVMKRTGFADFLLKLDTSKNSYSRRLKRIKLLQEMAEVTVNKHGSGKAALTCFLQDLPLEFPESQKIVDEDYKNHVKLMTLHAAKGLEFNCVFISGCQEGLLPLSSSDNPDEECRLFYVGVTRAMQRLYLTYATSKIGKEEDIRRSRFVDKLVKSETLKEAILHC